MNTRSFSNDPFAQDRQARLSLRLAGLLSAHAAQTNPDIDARLRFAREQALTLARQRRLTTAPATASSGSDTLALGGGPAWWLRTLAVLPLLLLVAGLGMVQLASQREQMLAAADVDAVLLADDLPPVAYGDPGFAEYLRSAPP